MARTFSLYEECHELFAGYPLAVKAVDHSGIICSMVLMLENGDDAAFFVLLRDYREGMPSYSVSPWPEGEGIVDIQAGNSVSVPPMAVSVVTRGIPIPRHGSLFGWTSRDTITALIPVYTEYLPECPQPRWGVMPLEGTPETEWPPFTDQRLFGRWFWQYYWAGSMTTLDSLIGGTQDTVFWVDMRGTVGSDCCAVAHDIRLQDGPALRRGCYVYYQALREERAVPPLRVLLADPGKTDLAPRFQRQPLQAR
jgi:hypothetical protein